VRVAIIDSGVHAAHPHVNGVAGGIGIGYDDYLDRLGHGTCVTAVIREKAPQAELYAVKIFDRTLAATIDKLVAGLRWAIEQRMDLINLSLGTANLAHAAILTEVVGEAVAAGTRIVAAYEDAGTRWLPGSLPGVVPVLLDFSIDREAMEPCSLANGATAYRASGYPRPMPGVSVEQNLKGISFAVANVTGILARPRSSSY
jgi:subtilisin family serine protease